MRYLDVLKEVLPKVFETVKEDILNEPEIIHFIESEEILNTLIETQREILTEYLENYPNIKKDSLEEIKKFYENLNIPYLVIEKNIGLIKSRIIEKLILEKDSSSEEDVKKVREYIDFLENFIAHIYIQKESKEIIDNFEEDIFRKYLLYEENITYMKKVINAILYDSKDIPVSSAKNCKFHEYLFYPESLMACAQSNACTLVEDLHESLHKVANTFLILYLNKKYKDAYISFKEFKEIGLKLSKTLSELYFAAFADAEYRFFNLIEYLEKLNLPTYIGIIDIENLKSLNKVYGEKKLNEILKEIESRIKDFVESRKDRYLVIRGFTSNFYLMIIDEDINRVKNELSLIRDLLNDKYPINGHHVEIKVNVGALDLTDYFATSKEELTRILQHIKDMAKEHNGLYVVHSKDEKQELEGWLNKKYKEAKYIKDKLENGEVDVVFQPIFDIETLSINSLESLARIVEDSGKLVPAGIFIETIYDIGLISKLDTLILEKIKEKSPLIKQITNSLFINISSESLTDPEFVDTLKRFIRDMKDFNITLEITEQKLVNDIDLLKELKNETENILFAIDDFGTGYSSLRLVADLAEGNILEYLKIDGSLIKDINTTKFTQKVVKAISSMSENLGLKTVAEFVEDKHILNELKENKINFAQGFFLEKPKPIEEILLGKIDGIYEKKLS